jgi:hypothetical protein
VPALQVQSPEFKPKFHKKKKKLQALKVNKFKALKKQV